MATTRSTKKSAMRAQSSLWVKEFGRDRFQRSLRPRLKRARSGSGGPGQKHAMGRVGVGGLHRLGGQSWAPARATVVFAQPSALIGGRLWQDLEMPYRPAAGGPRDRGRQLPSRNSGSMNAQSCRT